jgi:hypothetical protein
VILDFGLSFKRTVRKQLVKVIKEESEAIASAYESTFFRATDLQYLSFEETQLVKQHLFSSLWKRASSSLLSLLKAMEGIGDYLEAQDIPLLYEPLVRAYLSIHIDIPEQVIEEFLQNELWRGCHDKISKAVDHYFDSRMRQGRESPSGKAKIQELKSYVEHPF